MSFVSLTELSLSSSVLHILGLVLDVMPSGRILRSPKIWLLWGSDPWDRLFDPLKTRPSAHGLACRIWSLLLKRYWDLPENLDLPFRLSLSLNIIESDMVRLGTCNFLLQYVIHGNYGPISYPVRAKRRRLSKNANLSYALYFTPMSRTFVMLFGFKKLERWPSQIVKK